MKPVACLRWTTAWESKAGAQGLLTQNKAHQGFPHLNQIAGLETGAAFSVLHHGTLLLDFTLRISNLGISCEHNK